MDSISRRDFLQKTTAVAMGAGILATATNRAAADETSAATAGKAAPLEGSQSTWTPGSFKLKTAVKTSILKNVAGKDAGWEEKLTLAKECGFQGVEWDDPTTPEEGAKMAELAKKIGVPCHGVVFGGWHAPLSDNDPEVVKKGLEGMRTAISSANAIGVETCLLVPAVVTPEVSYDVAYKRSQENISKLIDHAKRTT